MNPVSCAHTAPRRGPVRPLRRGSESSVFPLFPWLFGRHFHLEQRAGDLSRQPLRGEFRLTAVWHVASSAPRGARWVCVAEYGASAAYSASCDQLSEHVRVVAVVVTERELRDVKREILLRH